MGNRNTKNYYKDMTILSFFQSPSLPRFLLVFSLMMVGCGVRLGPDSPTIQKNESLAAEVKVALVKEAGLNAAPLDVKVRNGVVTINGFVEDESQRQQAINAAQKVAGVQSVIDQIRVK